MIRNLVDIGCSLHELDLLLEIDRGAFNQGQVAARWGTETGSVRTTLSHLRTKGMVRWRRHHNVLTRRGEHYTLTRRGQHVLKMVRLLVCGEVVE